jgi:hypothetical protein
MVLDIGLDIVPDKEKDRHRRRRSLVGAGGFEPPTPCTPCKCATGLRYAPTLAGIIAHRSWGIKTRGAQMSFPLLHLLRMISPSHISRHFFLETF